VPSPDPILDYAKPSTPNYGTKYKFTVEELPGGIRLVGPVETENVRLAGLLLVALSLTCGLIGVVNLLHSEFPLGALMSFVTVLVGVGAVHHLQNVPEPHVVEVFPKAISVFNPKQLWGRRKRWRTDRVRKIKIIRRGFSLNAKPVGDLLVSTRFHQYQIIFLCEIGELDDIAARISAITGVPVAKVGLLGIG